MPIHIARQRDCGIRTVVAAAIALMSGAVVPHPVIAQTAPAMSSPTLVVQITVDQLRPDYFDRFASQLTGGLGRLRRNGAVFVNGFHDHATTETAPGHATLWSGRFPAHTGIVLNNIGVEDVTSPLLFGRGGGASPFRFRGSSFFDWVRAYDLQSRALSVSRKNRGAILPVGRAKQQVYWYGLDGRFTTSTYYADTIPTWVARFNATDPTGKYLGTAWHPLLPLSAYPEKDSIPTEHQGKDFVFPHTLPADRRAGTNEFVEFPWMDDITVDFALAGVNALALGASEHMDVLSVSLSTTDAVGHRYGPNSRELHDQILRVDRALGRLIDSLFVLRDSTRIVFALGSDHGVTPLPEEVMPGTDPNRGRVNTAPVMAAARKSLEALGVDGGALDLQSAIVSLERRPLAARGVNRDSVITALQQAFQALPGMERVYRTTELAGLAARGDVTARRWFHAIPGDFDAVLTLTMKPGYYWSSTRYATHGTPYDLDARIPIIFMGPMFRAGTYTDPVWSVDVAPTLGAATDIRPIERIDGRVLTEAFKANYPLKPH
jgi:predicted AlkP superfamily pyrophosphatase or phosphodiesterase